MGIQQITIVDTLSTIFPDAKVEMRTRNPTMWWEGELDAVSIFAIAAVATEYKLSFSLKRSGKSIRVVLK